MSAGWQLIDAAVRCLRASLKTAEFQKSNLARVHAVILRTNDNLVTLLSHYTSGKSEPSFPRLGEEQPDEPGSSQSPDADAAPGAES
jgi:hypothetical protein